MAAAAKESYLVIGGSGFLGRHVVEALLARGDTVSVFDIVQRHHDVPFYTGDISEEDQVADALEKSGTTCIIHTASPLAGKSDPALFWKVNVEGTKTVIAAAQKKGVRKLVYTSSAGVVFNGADVVNGDERLPFPEKPMDAYNESKAKGETAVLEANGEDGLLTVALRPASIFGPGDRQVMAGLSQVYERNQTHFQIGDNTNLFDWTYVGNVAHAHLLAADKLTEELNGTRDLAQIQRDITTHSLPQVSATTEHHRIPTSQARPLGPYLYRPEDADELEGKWRDPNYEAPPVERPVRRGKFDQFSDASIQQDSSCLSVAGQAFFITNGEPIYFWDFLRAVWKRLDEANGNTRKEKSRIVIPRSFGLLLAGVTEWYGWLVGKEPAFTRFRVTFSSASRWHNIEKARRLLGYEPIFGVEEGLDKMVSWYVATHGAPKA